MAGLNFGEQVKESVIRRKFANISESFFWWESAVRITECSEYCCEAARAHFNHPGKIKAIAQVAGHLYLEGFQSVFSQIKANPVRTLQRFPYIGPVTAYHLAKNIGVPVAKPDRHLNRLARASGFENVQEFCSLISSFVGDRIDVVDIVLWRYATLSVDYLSNFLSSAELRA